MRTLPRFQALISDLPERCTCSNKISAATPMSRTFQRRAHCSKKQGQGDRAASVTIPLILRFFFFNFAGVLDCDVTDASRRLFSATRKKTTASVLAEKWERESSSAQINI